MKSNNSKSSGRPIDSSRSVCFSTRIKIALHHRHLPCCEEKSGEPEEHSRRCNVTATQVSRETGKIRGGSDYFSSTFTLSIIPVNLLSPSL